ncbi:MAG: ATP-grasp domain-containing protein [Comamonadaceae bacterium]|nr:ATP-grasp domain-containing protein [Comamonadaceae bacterium]
MASGGVLTSKGFNAPCLSNPDSGRGSVPEPLAVNGERDLRFFLEYVPDPVVQEYLTGTEFTVDVLADFAGKVIGAVPRERIVIRSGVSDRGRTLNHPEIIDLAVRTAEALEI